MGDSQSGVELHHGEPEHEREEDDRGHVESDEGSGGVSLDLFGDQDDDDEEDRGDALAPVGCPRKAKPLGDMFIYFKNPSGVDSYDAMCRACNKKLLRSKAKREVNHIIKGCKDVLDTAKLRFARNMNATGYNVYIGDQVTKDVIDGLIVDFIAANLLPIRLTESYHLKELVAMIDRNYPLPKHTRLNSMIQAKSKKIRSDKIIQANGAGSCSLTVELDGWTSNASMQIMAVVLTTHCGEPFLLDLINISDMRHTGTNVAERVRSSIASSGISPVKFNCIVTDQGPDFRAARAELVTQLGPNVLIQYRCMAHVFNLIIGTMSKSNRLIDTLKNLISFIDAIDRRSFLKDHLAKLGAKRICRLITVRWYSSAEAIHSVLPLRDLLMNHTPHTEEYGYNRWGNVARDDGFWLNLRDVIPFYDRISGMIGLAERSDSLLSDSFRTFLEYMKFIEESRESRFSSLAMEAALVHFSKLDLDLLVAAYALNPNHKLQWLTAHAIERVRSYICSVIIWSKVRVEADKVKGDISGYFDLIQSQLDSDTDFITDLYIWWDESSFETLRVVGRRLAACHASSANTERIFSGLNHIVRPTRNRLRIESIYSLMTVRMQALAEQDKEKRKNRRRRFERPADVVQVYGGNNEYDEDDEPVELEAEVLDEDILRDGEMIFPADLSWDLIEASYSYKDVFKKFFTFENNSFIRNLPNRGVPPSNQENRSNDLQRMAAEALALSQAISD